MTNRRIIVVKENGDEIGIQVSPGEDARTSSLWLGRQIGTTGVFENLTTGDIFVFEKQRDTHGRRAPAVEGLRPLWEVPGIVA